MIRFTLNLEYIFDYLKNGADVFRRVLVVTQQEAITILFCRGQRLSNSGRLFQSKLAGGGRYDGGMTTLANPFRYFNSSPEVIRLVVMM